MIDYGVNVLTFDYDFSFCTDNCLLLNNSLFKFRSHSRTKVESTIFLKYNTDLYIKIISSK